MNADFWRDKRVLITGHTGFKGSWLSLWMQLRGAHVIGYALPPPTKPSLFNLAHVAEGMVSIDGDVRDLKNFQSVLDEYRPEIVIHMAAQALVRLSYDNPVETYSTNVMGTVNVLEAIRKSQGVRVLVNITSDKCYENREWVWGYRENEPMGGYDPYSSSKGCAELVTSAYRRSYFTAKNATSDTPAVATTRAGNVVGGGDWSTDRLISDIMKAFIQKKPAVIRNPNSIRPWQFVLEPLRGYLCLAEKLWDQGNKFAGAWNFGPKETDAQTVAWIADKFTELWGENSRWQSDREKHPHEAIYLKLDCSKAKQLLGWHPKVDLTTTLEWIVEWYQTYVQQKNMRQMTEEQIVRYEKLA